MADNTKKVVALLTQAIALLGSTTALAMPAPDKVGKLDSDTVTELAKQFGIDIEDKSAKEAKSLLLTAATIVSGEDTEDLDEDAITDLCAAVGVKPAKKAAATVDALKEYFDAAADSDESEDEESEDEDEEDEKPVKQKKSKSDDEDEDESSEDADEDADEDEDESEDEESEDEDEDEDEKPAKKKKKPAADEDEDEDEESADEDESEDEDEEESSDDDEEGGLTDKHVALYNKKAKKKIKTVKELKKLLVDGDGEAVEWGTPYVVGETAYCCGLPLLDMKKGKVEGGKCQITGKFFVQNDEGELEEG